MLSVLMICRIRRSTLHVRVSVVQLHYGLVMKIAVFSLVVSFCPQYASILNSFCYIVCIIVIHDIELCVHELLHSSRLRFLFFFLKIKKCDFLRFLKSHFKKMLNGVQKFYVSDFSLHGNLQYSFKIIREIDIHTT